MASCLLVDRCRSHKLKPIKPINKGISIASWIKKAMYALNVGNYVSSCFYLTTLTDEAQLN
ncbi:hypothetical protein BMETH_1353_1 [methanotrophic bacterial endosymbiont of Bathymodiolus sp.]|nr:hypothetical protein BMETH_1353_1 [methanotrophic bacterial endosymbiont of Bathymodiolus sp.]